MSEKSQSRAGRREQVLDAARDLLAQDGIRGVSMRRLAKASEMAVNTLYALFGTRDGVLEALVAEAIKARLEVLEGADDPSAEPLDRLDQLVVASVGHAIATPRITKPMYRAAGQLRGLRRTANRLGVGRFTALLTAAADAGALRADCDVGLLAELMMQVVNETSLAWALDEISDEVLEARARHALAVAVAAAVSDDYGPRARDLLREAERRLRALEAGSAVGTADEADTIRPPARPRSAPTSGERETRPRARGAGAARSSRS